MSAESNPSSSPSSGPTCTAFLGSERVASGDLRSVAAEVKARVDRDAPAPLLVFDDVTSRPIELDLRGSLDEVLARLPEERPEGAGEERAEARTPGRPKLGVVAREVTLLPRHWEWLATQPGGASVTLRKLVEAAKKTSAEEDRIRLRRDAAYRFMSAIAGNEIGFEEGIRALFAGQRDAFERSLAAWPSDVADHARSLAEGSFSPEE